MVDDEDDDDEDEVCGFRFEESTTERAALDNTQILHIEMQSLVHECSTPTRAFVVLLLAQVDDAPTATERIATKGLNLLQAGLQSS